MLFLNIVPLLLKTLCPLVYKLLKGIIIEGFWLCARPVIHCILNCKLSVFHCDNIPSYRNKWQYKSSQPSSLAQTLYNPRLSYTIVMLILENYGCGIFQFLITG